MRINVYPVSALAALLAIACSSAALGQGAARPTQASPAAAQANRVVDSAASSASVKVAGHLPAWVATARDLGPVSPAASVQLTFVLSRAPQVQAAFEQLLADQQNASSPRYRQWLTPQQIGSQYGPTQHDVDALTAWLASTGFHVDSVAPSLLFVQATAPVQVAESALHTTLHSFQLPYGNTLETVQAAIAEPSVPAALSPIVAAIHGLSNLPIHTHSIARPVPVASTNHAALFKSSASTSTQPDARAGSTSNPINLLTPDDFATIYDINSVYTAGDTGFGVKVMIVGGSRLNATDVTNWESIVNLNPPYQPNYIVGSSFTDPGTTSDDNQGEATLDFERVYGTAPGATVDMVIAKNWLSGSVNFSLQSYAINTVNDPVMSMSFSSCEAGQSSATLIAEDALYSQAAGQGISIFASSGDSGADTCEGHGSAASASQILSISDICASSWVTCVGGTEFNDPVSATYWSSINGTGEETALGYIPEGAWNEPTGTSGYVVAATGGGFSTSQPKPSWQSAPGVPADRARDVPDVSFSAAEHDGYLSCLTYAGATCSNGYLIVFSGTSATAPAMAGVAALLVQKSGERRLGDINKTLYSVANSTPAAFHDATPATSGVSSCSVATPSMCNNSDPSPTALTGGLPGYGLATGYDLATGLGSLDVANFIAAATLPAPTGTLTSSPTTITASQTVTFTATLTGSGGVAPTGTIQFLSSGVAPVGALTLVGGTVTTPALSFTSAGTYTITALYSGDSNYSGITLGPLSLVVTNPFPVASTSTLSASAASVTTTQTLSFTDTVTGASGTPTGTVQLKVDGTAQGSAATLASGKVTITLATLAVGTHSVTAVYSGDGTFASSTSNAVIVTVTAPASIALSPASASLTTAKGSSPPPDTITLTSTNFAGTETLTCSVAYNGSGTPNDIPSCGLTPLSVTLTSGGTASTSLSIASTAASAIQHTGLAYNRALTFTGTAFCGLLALCFPRRNRRSLAALRTLSAAIFLATTLAALSGCSSSVASPSNPGTTSGSYTVTVTASGTASATTTVSLTIQ